MITYAVTSDLGTRQWQADDEAHAREQHTDAFTDEPIVSVAIVGTVYNVLIGVVDLLSADSPEAAVAKLTAALSEHGFTVYEGSGTVPDVFESEDVDGTVTILARALREGDVIASTGSTVTGIEDEGDQVSVDFTSEARGEVVEILDAYDAVTVRAPRNVRRSVTS